MVLLSLFRLFFSFVDHEHARFVWVFRSKKVHSVSDLLLNLLQFCSWNELRQRIYLLLVKKRDKVVAKPADFTVSLRKRLFLEALTFRFLLFSLLLKSLNLQLRFGIWPLARLFFKNESQETTFFFAFQFFRTSSEEHGDLVNFNHDIREEKLVSVLRLVRLDGLLN